MASEKCTASFDAFFKWMPQTMAFLPDHIAELSTGIIFSDL